MGMLIVRLGTWRRLVNLPDVTRSAETDPLCPAVVSAEPDVSKLMDTVGPENFKQEAD